MKTIQENPYRIAGILANSTEKELQKQKSKITKYASIGKQVDSEYDFNFWGSVDRSEISITKAFSCIEQNQDKVNHSLFWFLKANPFDETAINYLINGDRTKAIEIWEKVTNGKEVTTKNYSCFNNIGTLKLLSETKEEIREGIDAKIKLIESPFFADFVNTVADQTYTINNQKQIENFVNDILKQFNGKYSSADTLKFFCNCNGSIQKYLTQKFTEEPLNKIETQIESCKKKRKVNKGNAFEFGLKLFTNTKDDLSLVKSFIGGSDLKFEMLADNLAKEVMQCGIDYFQEWKESKNPSEEGLKLLKYAQSIAIGKQTKNRIEENIKAVIEWEFLSKINTAYFDLEEIIYSFDNPEMHFSSDEIEMLLEKNPLPGMSERYPTNFGLRILFPGIIDEDLFQLRNRRHGFSYSLVLFGFDESDFIMAKYFLYNCLPQLTFLKNNLIDRDKLENINSAIANRILNKIIDSVNKYQKTSNTTNILRHINYVQGLSKIIDKYLDLFCIINNMQLEAKTREHFNKNIKALIGLVNVNFIENKPVKIISQKLGTERLELNNLNNDNYDYQEKELLNARERLINVKRWKLFRSSLKREQEIKAAEAELSKVELEREKYKEDKIPEITARIGLLERNLNIVTEYFA